MEFIHCKLIDGVRSRSGSGHFFRRHDGLVLVFDEQCVPHGEIEYAHDGSKMPVFAFVELLENVCYLVAVEQAAGPGWRQSAATTEDRSTIRLTNSETPAFSIFRSMSLCAKTSIVLIFVPFLFC